MELSKSDTTAIKGIAILLMLWHHLFLNTIAYGILTHSLAVVFKVCVALFLFVSGYGLTKQYSQLEKPYFKSLFKFQVDNLLSMIFEKAIWIMASEESE